MICWILLCWIVMRVLVQAGADAALGTESRCGIGNFFHNMADEIVTGYSELTYSARSSTSLCERPFVLPCLLLLLSVVMTFWMEMARPSYM